MFRNRSKLFLQIFRDNAESDRSTVFGIAEPRP
jgi:hypothetical protein